MRCGARKERPGNREPGFRLPDPRMAIGVLHVEEEAGRRALGEGQRRARRPARSGMSIRDSGQSNRRANGGGGAARPPAARAPRPGSGSARRSVDDGPRRPFWRTLHDPSTAALGRAGWVPLRFEECASCMGRPASLGPPWRPRGQPCGWERRCSRWARPPPSGVRRGCSSWLPVGTARRCCPGASRPWAWPRRCCWPSPSGRGCAPVWRWPTPRTPTRSARPPRTRPSGPCASCVATGPPSSGAWPSAPGPWRPRSTSRWPSATRSATTCARPWATSCCAPRSWATTTGPASTPRAATWCGASTRARARPWRCSNA